MAAVIKSSKNDKIKYLRKLYDNRKRRKEGKYILEGYRILETALRMEAEVVSLFMTPDFAGTEAGSRIKTAIDGDSIYYLTEGLLKEITATVNPQGVIAVVREKVLPPEGIFQGSERLVVLDRIQDPGNMGTLIRTASAAGFDGLITLKGCVDIYNLKVIRSTAGAIFSLPVVHRLTWQQFTEILAEEADKFRLVTADVSGELYYNELTYDYPVLLVIGNEAHGVRPEMLDMSDFVVKIPVAGAPESLNAAVAGSIIMYSINIKKLV